MSRDIIDFGYIPSDANHTDKDRDSSDYIDFGEIVDQDSFISSEIERDTRDFVDFGQIPGLIDTSSDRYFTDRVNMIDYGNVIFMKTIGSGGIGLESIYDKLDSTSIELALSANMGRVLDGKIFALSGSVDNLSNLISSHIGDSNAHLSDDQSLLLSLINYDQATNTISFLADVDLDIDFSTIESQISDLLSHVSNTEIHVTQADKDRWNSLQGLWMLDEDGNVYTDRNVYSTKEISAYGMGSGSGGGSGGATALSDLSDVNVSSIGSGYILVYDGTHWKSQEANFVTTWAQLAGKPQTIEQLGIPGIASTQMLSDHANDTSKHVSPEDRASWSLAASRAHTHDNKAQIDQITQVNIDVLSYLSIVDGKLQIDLDTYSTGELSAYGAGSGSSGGGGGVTTLAELDDVKLLSVVPGHILVYDGTHWKNQELNLVTSWADLSGKPKTIAELGVAGIASTQMLQDHANDSNVHVTPDDKSYWNLAASQSHTHANKPQIDQITQENIDVLSYLSIIDGKMRVDLDFYGTGEISAYGEGDSTGGGGGNSYDRLDEWNQYEVGVSEGFVLSAELGKELRDDVDELSSEVDSLSSSVNQIIETGGDKHYAHHQGSPSNTWYINHNLKKYPSIRIFDQYNREMVGGIEYININQAVVSFSATVSGVAYCN